MILKYILIIIGAYLLGSVSPSIIISSTFKKDVRDYGSGNAGATNMVRSFGWAYGLMTFFLDMLKGFLCSYLGKLIGGETGAALGALFGVIGHIFPIYYKFRGGKGVSTTMGTMLTFAFLPSVVVYLIAILLVVITGIVFVGSISGFILESIMICFIYPSLTGWFPKVVIVILTLLVCYAHRENFKRFFRGEENRLYGKKKEK